MKTNDYSIAEFKKQYIGIWDPSNEHWFGLDFIYNQKEYRFKDEVLNCTVIDNKKFEDILVDDMTEIIGQN